MTNEYPRKIEKQNNITDKKLLTKYVAAFLLGDGSIAVDSKSPNNNKRFLCAHSVKHLDYIEWKANILSNISPVLLHYRRCKRGNDSIMIQTRSLPFYTTFRERLYIGGVKRVDPHYLKLLDWETMAIWFMDDGFINRPHKHTTYVVIKICSNSYSYGDHLILTRAVKEKLGIEMNIRQIRENGNLHYMLYLPTRFIKKFIDGVTPFILPSFEYKVHLSNEELSLYTKRDGDIVRSSTNKEVEAIAEMTIG